LTSIRNSRIMLQNQGDSEASRPWRADVGGDTAARRETLNSEVEPSLAGPVKGIEI
jgi:hypothetical protein